MGRTGHKRGRHLPHKRVAKESMEFDIHEGNESHTLREPPATAFVAESTRWTQ